MQKFKHLAGKKKPATVGRENGCKLEHDVSKGYFSKRQEIERLRIAKQIKQGEEVLVMFSGCAQVPCMISKNSNARKVYGVELNRDVARCGRQNAARNNLTNIRVMQGDVREIVPNFYAHTIAVKTMLKPRELSAALSKKSSGIELFLLPEDLFEKQKETRKTIANVLDSGKEVMLYVAQNRRGKQLTLTRESSIDDMSTLEKAGRLCKDYGIRTIAHYATAKDNVEGNLCKNLERLKKYLPYFFFENPNGGLFGDYKKVKDVARRAGLKNVCIDTCHYYEYYKDNNKVLEAVRALCAEFNPYFHLVDADGVTHGLEIGKGKIDFDSIMPFVGEATVEVHCDDYEKPVEMHRSYDEITTYKKMFDRILMPLPHTANDLLDVALDHISPGGKIHFYDCLHRDDSPKGSAEKIESACKATGKKFKVIDYLRCGDMGVSKYILCVDFQVLN